MLKINRFKNIFVAIVMAIAMFGCSGIHDQYQTIPVGKQSNSNVYYKVEFSPGSNTTKLIVDTIQTANKSVYLAAYSLTSESIVDSLIIAHERGLDVRVILDRIQSRNKNSKYKQLINKGVPTRISKNYKAMHNKFMIIDNSIVQTGSFNYTLNAEKYNAENILIIYNDPELAHKYLKVWHKLWMEFK